MENRLSNMDSCDLGDDSDTQFYFRIEAGCKRAAASDDNMDISVFVCTVLHESDLYAAAAVFVL